MNIERGSQKLCAIKVNPYAYRIQRMLSSLYALSSPNASHNTYLTQYIHMRARCTARNLVGNTSASRPLCIICGS